MSKNEGPIAISIADCRMYGCPFCGYTKGYNLISAGNTNVIKCSSCGRGYNVVYNGETRSSVGCSSGDDTIYPEVQPHPLANQSCQNERG